MSDVGADLRATHDSYALQCLIDEHGACSGHLVCILCMVISEDRYVVPCECECHYGQWLEEMEVVVTKSLNSKLLATKVRITDDGRLLCGIGDCIAPGIRLATTDAYEVNDLLATIQMHRATYHASAIKPKRRPRGISPLSGRTAMEIASQLLLYPDTKIVQKDIAAAILRSPAGMSAPILTMKANSLITEKNVPIIPDLFWELSERWREETEKLPVLYVSFLDEVKAAHDALDSKSLNIPGIARVDAGALRAYDSDVNIDQFPARYDILVPEDLFTHYSGMCEYGASEVDAVARIRVAPIRMACWDRVPMERGFVPAARPLFIALELAQTGAGREILHGWTPRRGGVRVW